MPKHYSLTYTPDPAKQRAHMAVRRAVERGELVRPSHCSRCHKHARDLPPYGRVRTLCRVSIVARPTLHSLFVCWTVHRRAVALGGGSALDQPQGSSLRHGPLHNGHAADGHAGWAGGRIGVTSG